MTRLLSPLPVIDSDIATVTVLRPTKKEGGPLFLTVEFDRTTDQVVNALDEYGTAIPLTPGEEDFARRMVHMNLDETGR